MVFESSKVVHHDPDSIAESDIEVAWLLTVLVIITMMGFQCVVPGCCNRSQTSCLSTAVGGRPFVIPLRHCTSAQIPLLIGTV